MNETVAAPPPPATDDCAPGAIALTAISKWFDTTDGEPLTVLQNIDLAVPAHSIYAILGASGCGKSTLLNIISGILTPDRGNVCFGGVRARDFTGWRSISYMFQEDRLLPWRTARANVEFALEAGDMPGGERKTRAHEALALVGLAQFEDSFPHQLSGGMRSRVALARSLVTEPAILLMDEPFSRLDAQTRAQMHAELLQIHEMKHMTIVFVTHDVEEAVVLADQVVVLAPRPGRVREIVPIACPRPRDPTDLQSIRYIQRLRALI
ncbi:MAG: nitrate/sulfonate/bicarbonate transporter ATP-binding protein [Betaproteobacteria bacterium]|nr:nitrate/sulfonate/bicarbonate transporter ATP-binding protein [Betaproteobacteria bacterium]